MFIYGSVWISTRNVLNVKRYVIDSIPVAASVRESYAARGGGAQRAARAHADLNNGMSELKLCRPLPFRTYLYRQETLLINRAIHTFAAINIY